ncbi:hypothetical protein [Geodermatophilus sp. URMC 62]|uniref:hypothetical protein n=1 Tax=Geodermatophilus sp. URMC 62 TaxID=3423414 RepID=UPI00406C9628
MTLVLVLAAAWLVAATVLGLVLGRGIRLADERTHPCDVDLGPELDAVLAGLEDDLRTATAG